MEGAARSKDTNIRIKNLVVRKEAKKVEKNRVAKKKKKKRQFRAF